MGIYHSPFTVLTQDSFATLEAKFNEWWDAAEAQAGDRLEYVKRSRWQLRYMSFYIHPDYDTAKAFVEEVEANGTHWREGDPVLLWYAYERNLLSLSPDKWYDPPSEQK